MIEKEFIPYDQALALKELGFDEPCFGYFTGDLMHLVIRPAMSRINEPESYVVTAPLYQQAFRWLYQKLGIEKGVMPLDIESQQLLLDELLEQHKKK